MPTTKLPFLAGGNVARRGTGQMTVSLLDECRESILKIAETQPPDGKKAIRAMAEMFRVNTGRTSVEGPALLSQNFRSSDRQPMLARRSRSSGR